MKRLIPVLSLLLGASVSSQAIIITSAIDPAVIGVSGSLIDFEGVTLGSNAFTSLPFNVTQSLGPAVSATIATANTGSFTGTGGVGNLSSINDVSALNAAAGNRFLTNWNYTPAFGQTAANLANRLTLAFNTGLAGVDFVYSGNDSNSANNLADAGVAGSRNRVIFNTCTGTWNGTTCSGTLGSEAGIFANQRPGTSNNTNLRTIGSTQSAGTVITSIVIEFNGLDNGPGFAVDFMAFDRFNAYVAATPGTSTPGTSVPPTTSTPGGNPIPEPSTYALVGAGLAALAYARRK